MKNKVSIWKTSTKLLIDKELTAMFENNPKTSVRDFSVNVNIHTEIIMDNLKQLGKKNFNIFFYLIWSRKKRQVEAWVYQVEQYQSN